MECLEKISGKYQCLRSLLEQDDGKYTVDLRHQPSFVCTNIELHYHRKLELICAEPISYRNADPLVCRITCVNAECENILE